MVNPFLRSSPGRLLLAAAAVFLAAGAAGVISGSLYAIGIGFPTGITLAFVAVGLGLGDYTRETLFSVLVLPPALWGFFYLTQELDASGAWIGYVMAILALAALARAAFPPGEPDEA